MFYFSVLDQKKLSLMRESGKKNNEPILGKVNEGDQIKKTFDLS